MISKESAFVLVFALVVVALWCVLARTNQKP